MLIITRRKGESVIIGDNIKVTLLKSNGNRSQIGIEAPESVPINREEKLAHLCSDNRLKEVKDLL